MMGSPLLISLLVFLQLLAIIAHARTLSENSLNAFRQTDNLEMPTSLSPPFPAARETSTPDSSSCNRLIMRITQIKRPPMPSPSPPHTPPGPHQKPRPYSPAECLYCSWFNSITTRTSPCCGKSSSSLASSSPAHEKSSDFNYHCTAQGLRNNFRNRMDSKRPSVPPSPTPPIPNIPIASSSKSPPRPVRAYLHETIV
ncbi:leucine-rich repeat extensin-like protein 5 [Vitis riparia]|uniref:leucine-rich repeat extensin-like protein 5 n=1 Tax=Vitis riparia TaxID=96939 RepID=UPI00155AE9E9|nr:leucine-rich repeat extensin-like protein 5 [Vitis riparia]